MTSAQLEATEELPSGISLFANQLKSANKDTRDKSDDTLTVKNIM